MVVGVTLIGFIVSPLLQEYVVPAEPPVAVNVAVPPGQMVGEFTLIDNEVPIVTVDTAVPIQPASLAVTV